MLDLSEQEIEDIHVLRRSIYPLILKLILIGIIFLIVNGFIFFLAYELSKNLKAVLYVCFLVICLTEIIFGGVALSIALNWLGDIYIIKFPELRIRTGVINIVEKKVTVTKVSHYEIEQGILGKALDYGNVNLEGAVNGVTDLKLIDMPSPRHVAKIFEKKPEEELL